MVTKLITGSDEYISGGDTFLINVLIGGTTDTVYRWQSSKLQPNLHLFKNKSLH